MKIYPVNLLIESEKCLIVGGGKVATRKMLSLLKSGAEIHIIADSPSSKITAAHQDGNVILKKRKIRPGDINGMSLVYAATDDRSLNQIGRASCRERV